jgi:ATP-binding cassette subfamily A (ABC1) protein 3
VYLPAWIIMAVVWHARIFAGTSLGLILLLHLLLGLVLAAHGLFLAVPFGKSPQLAATASTFGALGGAILALVLSGGSGNSTGAAIIFSLILPSGFYVYAVRAIVGWELHQIPTDALKPDPDNGIRLLPILLITIVSFNPEDLEQPK